MRLIRHISITEERLSIHRTECYRQNIIIFGIFVVIGTLWLFTDKLATERIESARTFVFVAMAMF